MLFTSRSPSASVRRLYTPAAFLFATVILRSSPWGTVAMARKIRAAGGFYSFILAPALAAVSAGPPASRRLRTRCSRSRARRLRPTSPTLNFNDWFGLGHPLARSRLWRGGAEQRPLLSSSVEAVGPHPGFRAERRDRDPHDLRRGSCFVQGGKESINFAASTSSSSLTRASALAAGAGCSLAFWSWWASRRGAPTTSEIPQPAPHRAVATTDLVHVLGIGYVITSLPACRRSRRISLSRPAEPRRNLLRRHADSARTGSRRSCRCSSSPAPSPARWPSTPWRCCTSTRWDR